jgi:hypothetical protein
MSRFEHSETFVYTLLLALPCAMEKLTNENSNYLKNVMNTLHDYFHNIYPANKTIKHRRIFKKEHNEYLLKIYEVINSANNIKTFKSDFLLKFKNSSTVLDKITIRNFTLILTVISINLGTMYSR